MPPATRQIIEGLRTGETYRGNDSDPFVIEGRIDGPALELLIQTFRDSTGDPRGELAHLLVAVGKAGDELRPKGGDALRDPRVISALVELGLARQDGAKETCLSALIQSVPPALVAPHGDALAASLAASPDQTTAMAVAKAKPKGGLAALEKAIKSAPWIGKTREAELLRAALGDAALEKKLLAAFAAEKSPEKKARLARELGLVGTPATLKALGAELRSPVVYETPSSVARSQRLDILPALQLAFPEEPALYPNTIRDDSGYAAAEAFVEKRLGVTFTSPRPPFLTQNGRPF